jgi:hypothetical protein
MGNLSDAVSSLKVTSSPLFFIESLDMLCSDLELSAVLVTCVHVSIKLDSSVVTSPGYPSIA